MLVFIGSSRWVLSDEYPYAKVSIGDILSLFPGRMITDLKAFPVSGLMHTE